MSGFISFNQATCPQIPSGCSSRVVLFTVVYYRHGQRASLPALIDARGISVASSSVLGRDPDPGSTSFPPPFLGLCCPERSTAGPAGALGPHVLPVSQTVKLLSFTFVVLECDRKAELTRARQETLCPRRQSRCLGALPQAPAPVIGHSWQIHGLTCSSCILIVSLKRRARADSHAVDFSVWVVASGVAPEGQAQPRLGLVSRAQGAGHWHRGGRWAPTPCGAL